MAYRKPSLSDRLIAGADTALRTLLAPGSGSTRANPADNVMATPLSDEQRKHSSGLMRVNHAGEVAAQALYQGHALVARNAEIKSTLEQAADEERDHLNWCTERLQELGSRPSLLNGVWYTGAFALGALSGVAGDRWSLGLIAETERQVVAHLDEHLTQLPATDHRSRRILESMRDEEAEHGRNATLSGGAALPEMAKQLMRRAAKIMTTTAYWV